MKFVLAVFLVTAWAHAENKSRREMEDAMLHDSCKNLYAHRDLNAEVLRACPAARNEEDQVSCFEDAATCMRLTHECSYAKSYPAAIGCYKSMFKKRR